MSPKIHRAMSRAEQAVLVTDSVETQSQRKFDKGYNSPVHLNDAGVSCAKTLVLLRIFTRDGNCRSVLEDEQQSGSKSSGKAIEYFFPKSLRSERPTSQVETFRTNYGDQRHYKLCLSTCLLVGIAIVPSDHRVLVHGKVATAMPTFTDLCLSVV